MQTIGIDKDEEQKVIGYLASATKNLDTVIVDMNTILEVKHMGSEQRQQVSFTSLLNKITISMQRLIQEEGVQIHSDFSAVDSIITINSYIYSIFLNLITNSIKYRQEKVAPVIFITSSIVADKNTDPGKG
jgi:signal transduction histidine kinase